MEELFAAIKAGDAERVRALLAEDPERASARDAAGLSAVLTALYHRQPEALEALLAADPELDVLDAAATGRLDLLRAHVETDQDALARPLARGLHAAAPGRLLRRRRRGPAAARGRDADADADQENPARVRPLHSAVAARDHDAARALLEAGADPDCVQQGGFTPLLAAAHHDDASWPSCCCATAPTPRSRPTTAATRRPWPARASRSCSPEAGAATPRCGLRHQGGLPAARGAEQYRSG